MSPFQRGSAVIPMIKNKTDKAFVDMEMNTVLFYREMKGVLGSNKGKRYQFMMLGRTFETLMCRSSQIRKEAGILQNLPLSPLDME